jgi:hypothetical protein
MRTYRLLILALALALVVLACSDGSRNEPHALSPVPDLPSIEGEPGDGYDPTATGGRSSTGGSFTGSGGTSESGSGGAGAPGGMGGQSLGGYGGAE